MPKIPTFKSRERMTSEVGGVTSDISLSPFRTVAGALRPLGKAAEDYYVKERNIKEKTEAAKAFVELSSELDTIQEGASNQFDIEQANSIYQNQSQFLLKEKLSKIKNRRVKSMLQSEFDLDSIQRKIKIKQDVRNRLDEEFEYNNKIKKEQNLSRYKIATNPDEKKIIREKLLSDEESNGMSLGDSAITIQKNKDIVRQELLVFDIEKLIENRNFATAKNILEDINNTPFLDSDKRSQLLDTLNDEYNTIISDSNIDNLILNDSASIAVAAGLKNVDGSDITKKDIESGMNRMASAINEKGEKKYTTPQVIEKSIRNNFTVPIYKDVMISGSANISDTGDMNLTQQGLEIYRLFKNQNGLPTLRSTYKLDKETLETYAALDYSMNVMRETFDSAFKRQLQIKNKPEDFRLRTVSDKKIDSVFNELDMPGLFDADQIENVQTTKYLLSSTANQYYKAGGSEEDAIEGAKNFIEENYRTDLFDQIVPKNNFTKNDDEHDAAIKLYIKKIYDEGLVNKEKHELDDIYPQYFSYGDLSNQQGFVLTNKKTGEPLTIDATKPSGDYDDKIYNSSRLTQKDIESKIYPLIQNEKYIKYVGTWNLLRQKSLRIDNLKQPVVKSGFGDPIE